jgi:hypothetical protein
VHSLPPMRGAGAVPRVASVSLNMLISRAVDQDRVRIQAIALQCTRGGLGTLHRGGGFEEIRIEASRSTT